MKFLCVIIISAFLTDPIRAFNCSKNACTIRGLQHHYCTHPNQEPGPQCEEVISAELTEEEKQLCLDTHNKLRMRVAQGLEKAGNPGPQPPAANMRIMVWDDELARSAQRWANQCMFALASCANDDRFLVSQNLVRLWSGTSSNEVWMMPDEVIEKYLYSQVNKFDRNQVCKFTNTTVYGYPQIVWAKTYRLGCGKILFRTPSKDSFLKYHLTCMYGPRGNLIGKSVYEVLKT